MFQHGPDLDLFCLTYFRTALPGLLSPQPLHERLQSLVNVVGEAAVRDKLAKRDAIRHQAERATSRDSDERPSSPGPRLNWPRLQPGASYSAECHVDVPDFEARALRDLKDGLNILLQAPVNHGRGWWLLRLLSLLRGTPGYRCVLINFADWSPESYQYPENLFPRLQRELILQLRVEKDELEADRQEARSLADAWDVIRAWRRRPEVRATQLILFFDSASHLMDSRSQNEFFSPLRSLCQNTERTSIVLCLDRNSATAPGGPRRSRLALGPVYEVPDFNRQQVQQLAAQYQRTDISSDDLDQLWALIGGTPHLNRAAFYQAARRRSQPFASLLEEATAVTLGGGLFSELLIELKERLTDDDRLVLRDVYTTGTISPARAESTIDRVEQHLGLITPFNRRGGWRLRLPLYLHLIDARSEGMSK